MSTNSPPTQELSFTTRQQLSEPLADLLQDLGAVAVTFQDNQDCPQFEEHLGELKLWPETHVIGLFPAELNLEPVLLQLYAHAPVDSLHQIRIDLLEQQNWQETWKDYVKPMTFGHRIRVSPSWAVAEQAAESHRACELILDPGMAFGTGTHATTRLMLEWIDEQDWSNKTVVDYGCGSGILGLAAAKLGSTSVIAIDNDPNAVATTQSNAQLNHIGSEQLSATLNGADEPAVKADVVIANILANPLKQLAPHLTQLTTQGGTLVLSGLLHGQLEEVLAAYQPHFTEVGREIMGDWARLVLTKA